MGQIFKIKSVIRSHRLHDLVKAKKNGNVICAFASNIRGTPGHQTILKRWEAWFRLKDTPFATTAVKTTWKGYGGTRYILWKQRKP